MKICYLGEESRAAFVDFIKTAPEDKAWEAISEAEFLQRRFDAKGVHKNAIAAIVAAGHSAYVERFGEEWAPF